MATVNSTRKPSSGSQPLQRKGRCCGGLLCCNNPRHEQITFAILFMAALLFMALIRQFLMLTWSVCIIDNRSRIRRLRMSSFGSWPPWSYSSEPSPRTPSPVPPPLSRYNSPPKKKPKLPKSQHADSESRPETHSDFNPESHSESYPQSDPGSEKTHSKQCSDPDAKMESNLEENPEYNEEETLEKETDENQGAFHEPEPYRESYPDKDNIPRPLPDTYEPDSETEPYPETDIDADPYKIEPEYPANFGCLRLVRAPQVKLRTVPRRRPNKSCHRNYF